MSHYGNYSTELNPLHILHLRIKQEVPNFPYMLFFEFEEKITNSLDKFFYNNIDDKLLNKSITYKPSLLLEACNYIASGFTIFNDSFINSLYKDLFLYNNSYWDIFKLTNFYFDYFFAIETKTYDIKEYYNSNDYKLLVRGKKLKKIKNKINEK